MKKIVYYRAETLNEAYKMLSTKKSEIIAGGTDLIVRLRLGISLTSKLVDISQIKELRKLESLGVENRETILEAWNEYFSN